MEIELAKGAAYQVIDGQVVVVSPSGEHVYLLDPAALPLWKKFEAGTCFSKLNAEEASCAAYLVRKGLLEAEASPEAPSAHTWVLSEEEVEVMAAICDSSRLGGGGLPCRTFGTCAAAFE